MFISSASTIRGQATLDLIGSERFNANMLASLRRNV